MVGGINLKNEKVTQFNDFCGEACVVGKQSKLPFSTRRKIRSSHPLELIYTDILCGPITSTIWDSYPTGPHENNISSYSLMIIHTFLPCT